MSPSDIIGLIGSVLIHPVMMLIYGLAAHFLKALGQIKKNTGVLITPRQYYLSNPYQTALAFIGSIVGYAIFIPDIDNPAPDVARVILATAFTIGYMADSVVDMVGQRSGLNKPEVQKP